MSELVYPEAQAPAKGEWIAVADGVYWLQMALPMALDHINLYVLEDDEGWWIVDTGMKVGDTQERWQLLFDTVMKGKPVIGVICTHLHPDHIGQAGWLCERWRAPLYMSQLEYFSARAYTGLSEEKVSWTTEAYFQRSGVPRETLEILARKNRGFGAIVEPLPKAFNRLSEGQYLKIGRRQWRVMIGRGHSPEHVCLYSESDKILLSGDQIIPKITSNVSVMPTEQEVNPLADWLHSLRRFSSDLADDTLVLPAHNAPFYGVKNRLKYLIAHHEGHLAAVTKACVTPSKAVDLFGVLFSREIGKSVLVLALGEVIAHLNYLMVENVVRRELHEDGVYRYTTIDVERYQDSVPLTADIDPLQV